MSPNIEQNCGFDGSKRLSTKAVLTREQWPRVSVALFSVPLLPGLMLHIWSAQMCNTSQVLLFDQYKHYYPRYPKSYKHPFKSNVGVIFLFYLMCSSLHLAILVGNSLSHHSLQPHTPHLLSHGNLWEQGPWKSRVAKPGWGVPRIIPEISTASCNWYMAVSHPIVHLFQKLQIGFSCHSNSGWLRMSD